MLSSRLLSFFALIALVASFAFLATPLLEAQSVQGAVSITVTDPANAVIPGAKLELKATATNDLRTGLSQESGTYRFVGLNLGRYSLTVTKEGFSKAVVDPIVVDAARVTDVAVQLKLGATTTTVEVASTAEQVLEASSNMIASTIDVQQIENLPISGRDITAFARLAPGYNGTWDGAPAIAQGNNIDGVISSSSRMKFGGNAQPSVSPRIENIEEMTVQTDQLDMDQGFGASVIQLNFITRSGTNSYHGRLYEDFRNKDLNANSWANNGRGIPRAPFILNNFGGSVGGPILKNKLFFFGSFSVSKQPGSNTASNTVLTSAAQQGNFSYIGSDGTNHSINVLNLVNSFNPSLPHTINPIIAAEQANINGSLNGGVINPSTDPNINNINWLFNSPTTNYYPTGRLDYNPTNSLRLHATMNMQQTISPTSGAPRFPGGYFANQSYGFKSISATYSVGADWTVKPTVVNQFKAGFLYNPVWNPWYNGPSLWLSGVGTVGWPIASSGVTYPYLPISNYYPNITISDSVAWQKGSHQIKFGVTAWQEHDHYWNAPQGITQYSLGLVTGDPALGPFSLSAFPGANNSQLTEAQSLYATLVGRISGVGGEFGVDPKTKQYIEKPGSDFNLNELLRSAGLFAQDSWHVSSKLTVNLGLRWDLVGDNHDLQSTYHSALPQDVFGPSGVGQIFRPGVLNGDFNPNITAREHVYNAWKVTPQPQVGLAWRPGFKDGILGKTLGDKTVIRTGFSLRKYTEPQQYFWNQATDYGAAYFQQFFLNPNGNNGIAGSFAPGALNLGDPLPAFGFAPSGTYQTTIPLAPYTFNSLGGGTIVNGINPNIQQPYTMSWNFGIQRELGQSRVLEVRYNGNRSVHQWLTGNINEVNVFNGFLQDFQTAQNNLNINAQHGVNNSFANMGFAGQGAMPIFDAAFAGEKVTNGALQDYGNTTFITNLKTGQIGRVANTLSGISGTAPYFCNMVGAAFTPCATNAGYTGKGAGYPINFWQANPFSAGGSVQYMDSIGFSDYHALQVDLRQRTWHGLEFDANYTWSHSLGLATPNDWEANNGAIYTLRNLRLSYGPTLYDLRHVVHASVTGELPFGKGRRWMNHGGILNQVLGGWNIGNILTFQSGVPTRVVGGNRTYNDYGDSGVVLNGITAADLQSAVGVYHVGAARGGYVDLIDPTRFKTNPAAGTANPQYFSVNTTPGTFGQIFYLYGPHQTFNDTSISKIFPITEKVRFSFQSEFLNVFNHPTFGWGSLSTQSIQSSSFGTGGVGVGPRNIEFRGNIIF